MSCDDAHHQESSANRRAITSSTRPLVRAEVDAADNNHLALDRALNDGDAKAAVIRDTDLKSFLSAEFLAKLAGPSTSCASGENRFDLDAIAYWELRNIGFGDQAAELEAH